MDSSNPNASFVGTIPALYDECLGPIIFAPYAADLAKRMARTLTGSQLLETACGTGLLTRHLDAALRPEVRIKATDLNEAMLAYAKAKVGPSRRIEWQQADAAALPFPTAAFDGVVCQFGLMFVPEKSAAFQEARRVLRAGGAFGFNVWCSLEENAFAQLAHETIARFFGGKPPNFYQVPFGFHDARVIEAHLASSGFIDVALERVTLEVTAPSARHFARGLVEGNPISNSIRDAGLPFGKIVDAVAAALVTKGGDAPFRSPMSALVGSARAG